MFYWIVRFELIIQRKIDNTSITYQDTIHNLFYSRIYANTFMMSTKTEELKDKFYVTQHLTQQIQIILKYVVRQNKRQSTFSIQKQNPQNYF